MKVTVILPALNEKDAIRKTIESIPKESLAAMGFQTQILVVDNGSVDGTSEIAKESGAEVILEPKRGYGFAYKAGFAHANGDIIVTFDADGTYPADDIPRLISTMQREGLDFITTNRYADMQEGSMTSMHKLGNKILNVTLQTIYGLRIQDTQSGMWVIKKDLINQFVLKSNSMPMSEELKLEACYFLKCKWKEEPIQYRARIGKAKLRTWQHGFENLFYLFEKRMSRTRQIGS
jgi:dolichol-phosphate hexosyltransferase